MAVEGDIADEARTQMPVTWDYLSKDERYGDVFLQRKVDLVKSTLFGSVVDPDDEADLYEAQLIEYAGKLVALKIIPAGADWWATQKLIDQSGQRESATFADRAAKLWDLHERLQADVAAQRSEISDLLGEVIVVRRRRRPVGATAGINDEYLTPEPTDVPRQAAVPDRTAAV